MSRVVLGMLNTPREASTALEKLTDGGFKKTDVSMLAPNQRGEHDFTYEHHTKAPEGAVTGFLVGGLVGGLVGIMAGVGAISVPGLAILTAAGPLLAMLSGAAALGAVLGLFGACVGVAMPKIEAKAYDGKVHGSKVLIAVHAVNGEEVKRAKSVLRAAGAVDVFSTGEARAREPKHTSTPSIESQN